MVSLGEELSRAYLRRDPGSGVLYEVPASHLETFLARSEGDGVTPGLPRHVVRELRAYHGVLAGGSMWRDDVVVGKGPAPRPVATSDEKEPIAAGRPPHKYLWSELMRRVFGFEVLRCPACKGRRRLVSMIMQRRVIVRILAHLGLEPDPPPISPARAPPQLEFEF